MMFDINHLNTIFLLFWVLARGSGQNWVVLGLGTPLDHPPETTQWVTAWVGGILYIIYK